MVDEAKAETPGRTVEVWAFDEHRLGLKPVIRRVWARRSERPTALATHKDKHAPLGGQPNLMRQRHHTFLYGPH